MTKCPTDTSRLEQAYKQTFHTATPHHEVNFDLIRSLTGRKTPRSSWLWYSLRKKDRLRWHTGTILVQRRQAKAGVSGRSPAGPYHEGEEEWCLHTVMNT